MDVHETCYLWCVVRHQNNCLEIKYQGNKYQWTYRQVNWLDNFQREKYKWPITILKSSPVFIAIRNIKIKITLRYYPSLVWIATINKHGKKCWRGHGENESLCTAGGGKINITIVEIIWKCLKKLKIELPYDFNVYLWAYIQRSPFPSLEIFAHLCLLLL